MGLTAVAAALQEADGKPIGGVAIATPSVGFHRDRLAGWVNRPRRGHPRDRAQGVAETT